MENQIIMKIFKTLVLVLATVLMPAYLSAGKVSDPQGTLVYCLPSTTVTLEVTALQENFFAGPYAKYAEKYLGVKARVNDEVTFQITDISLVPTVEADLSCRYSIYAPKGVVDASFLKLSGAGLVAFADAASERPVAWRFPVESDADFSGKGITSNFTSEAATLYKNEKRDSRFGKVSVQQNMIVAKTLEQKAAETAEMILDLRKQRLQIVTGDTDATYSGEAMGAAVAELTRLEKEYMTLFIGYSVTQTQTMNFDVIPQAGRENQKYIAFRLSDTTGLLPAENISGKPVVIEFIPQEIAQVAELDEKQSKNAPAALAYYRIPAMCTVKVTDGTTLLLQTRMPVYQLGQVSSLPVNVILK